MNPLASLKEKLMIKPNVEERERVAVVIKGIKKRKVLKIKKDQGEEEGKDDEEEGKEDEKQDKEKEDEEEEDKDDVPLIVDETQKGYDRESLFKKLMENKKMKVTVKPTIKMSEEKQISQPISLPNTKYVKKIENKKTLVIESDEDDEEEVEKKKVNFEEPEESPEEFIMKPKKKEDESIQIIAPKKKKRITEKPEKGVAILGPETLVQIGDTDLSKRMPRKSPPVLIKVSSYYMNNREKFVNFINSLFEPYRKEMQENTESISCDTIGQSGTDFSLLTHQKIVRDYLNLYTPYRGLLLYHGLGSGKTCTSIAIAEGMKDSKRVIILTPASLRANYIEELKKCGDQLYKRNQYWEWISTVDNHDALHTISAVLNLPMEYIRKNKGAFFINVTKEPNYETMPDVQRKALEEQLNEMINNKYKFINYNGLRSQKLSEMTKKFTENIFDNSVIIIDEAHNLISRIVNKIKKEKPISGEERSHRREEQKDEEESLFGEQTPINLATKLYYMLLRAKNARIVLLTGTPIINYPNEFAILFNILRGYIKTWKLQLDIKTSKKVDKPFLQEILMGEKSMDYVDYSPSNKILTITRNPFGFKNKIKVTSGYQGVSNVSKNSRGETSFNTDVLTDDEFQKNIASILRKNEIDIIPQQTKIINNKALPDDLTNFILRYINDSDKKLKNVDALKRRIIGLSSYFKSAQESLLPKYTKTLGRDYHVVHIEMSDMQFKAYESARKQERLVEKNKRKKPSVSDLFQEQASTYRIFSRLFCNFIIPDRPIPEKKKKKGEEEKGDEKEGEEKEGSAMVAILNEGAREESKQDVSNERIGEIEGDEILENIGGEDYKERLDRAIQNIETHPDTFLTPETLMTYSPKFLHILDNIKREENIGLHLVYSQFRTAEGIGLFSLVLDANGFARFKINKNKDSGIWEIVIPEKDQGKPTYALYTGTESSEEKEYLRRIYNGEWDNVPESISYKLREMSNNNNLGEIIKVFMITSSGSEGINLRNTRYVHIMEPYWHPVRLEQVIGRARRICSHKDLDEPLRTVEVFVYLMVFSEKQLAPGENEPIELKLNDVSKGLMKVPITSDQYLYEISEIKANLTAQLTDVIKESAFDCYIYTTNGKCVNFGDPTNDKMAYVPEFGDQQNDVTVQANKVAIDWVGKVLTLGTTKYISRQMSKNVYNLYDVDSYYAAQKDPSVIPVQIGTLEKNEQGKWVLLT